MNNTMIKTEDTVQINMTWTEYNRLMHVVNEKLTDMEYDVRYHMLLELYRKMYMTRKVSEGKWVNC